MTSIAERARSLVHDPGDEALRKALRLVVVLTPIVILGHTLIDDPEFSTFASFGAIAVLAFADFGGPLRVRFGLGVAFGVVGSCLIVVGTFAAGHLVAATVVMAVAGFTLSFVGVFGGYAASGNFGLMVAVVLALLMPGGPDDLGSRVAGWLFACVVGAAASVVLWPVRYRPRARLDLAVVARNLAALLSDPAQLSAKRIERCADDIVALRTRLDADITRPSGPRARDQALLYLLDSAGRSIMFLRRIDGLRRDGASLTPTDVTAMLGAAEVLEATGDVLTGVRTSVSTATLVADRAAEIAAVQEALVSTDDGSAGALAPEQIVDRFDLVFPVRMVTYLALSMATNALVATGNPTGDTTFEYQSSAPTVRRTRRDALRRFVRTIRSHLSPRSRWFRNSMRVALALGAAVAIADLAEFEHSFWIGLSALSVLRSSVVDTGATVLAAVVGTVAGFALATGVLSLAGDEPIVLWVVFPFAVFAAGYLPKAVDYGAGQAAFTLMVIVLYNLAEPVGWHLGLIRLERVGLGVTVAALTAVALWPHGASHDLANAIRAEIDAAMAYLAVSLRSVLRGAVSREEHSDRLHTALGARMIAESELGNFMNSRGSKRLDVGTWARLVSQPHALLLGGDWLDAVSARQGSPAAVSSPDDRVQEAVTALEDAAARLVAPLPTVRNGGRTDDAGSADRTSADRTSADRTSTDQTSTDRAAADTDEASIRTARETVSAMVRDESARASCSEPQAIALLWALQWLTFVWILRGFLREGLADVDRALGRSWWR